MNDLYNWVAIPFIFCVQYLHSFELNMAQSIEEKVEDKFKRQLDEYWIKYFSKTESINSTIDNALKNYISKSWWKWPNYPDIKILLQTPKGTVIPVMIEVKWTKWDLIKYDTNGNIELVTTKSGKENYGAIKKYAVNWAVHYANAILSEKWYDNVIAIWLNGYEENGTLVSEMWVYYVSKENFNYPNKIWEYSDLKFLKHDNLDELEKKLKNLYLTDEEIHALTKSIENDLDAKLRWINQVMQDTHQINVNHRVNLIAWMIMAWLWIKDKVSPLHSEDLHGNTWKKDHDWIIIYNKIDSFLSEKNLPEEKKNLILSILNQCFLYTEALYTPINWESKLKSIYKLVERDILPIFEETKIHLDFTGKLFNVLNDRVSVPDWNQNDVVLTPRYVTDLMAKLARVNKDSYVLDTATWSSWFLVSSMKLMIQDCENIVDKKEREAKIMNIKCNQLLWIEKLPDIYMLAVLNMLLMWDGSSNILNKNSLTDFDWKYTYWYWTKENEKFPANVFLLNPPYSAEWKWFIFVEKALATMESWYAAILIQENAGSGNGWDYTKRILKQSTLLSSIHMADIFCWKAGVQTAIYVFKVWRPHEKDDIVTFIDFSNDWYSRQNRKKSSQDVNLRDTDHAVERYAEIVSIVLWKKTSTNFFTEENWLIIKDVISLEWNDWTFKQHQKIDTKPTLQDFKKTVSDYLAWEVSNLLKNQSNEQDRLGK